MTCFEVHRRGTATLAMACLVAGLLAGCGAAPEPTFSPSEAATRLAAIPTAANVNANVAAIASPQATGSAAPTTAPQAVATSAPTAMPVEGNFAQYTVKAGDTLSTIAFNFKISMASIQRANQLGDSQIVQVGQSLKIPLTKMFPDENVLWIVVTVEPGDTLGAICQRYGTSLDDTVRVNQLGSASDIRAGQELIMPIRSPESDTGADNADAQALAKVLIADTAPPAASTAATPIAIVTVAAPTAEPALDPTDVPAEPTPEPAPEVEAAAEIVPIVPIVPVAVAEPTLIPDVLSDPATPIPGVELVAAAPAQKQAPAANTAMSVASVASTDPFGAGDIEFMRARMLVFYNQARAAAGLGPLNLSFTLQQAAQLHAQDCGTRGYGSHVGSDGSSSQLRVQRAGYYGKYTGENWAWGHTAEEAFDMWFTQEYPSGPHRDNILGANYTDVGFGIVPSQGGYYFIANLGAS